MADATVTPNTQEAINSINTNMANVVDFQNQTNTALAMWSARIAVNEKCWSILDQVIQGLQR